MCAPKTQSVDRLLKLLRLDIFKTTTNLHSEGIILFYTLNSYNTEAQLDPNKMWGKWRNVFTTTADKHVPLITRKVRSQHTPWLTSEIKKRMNHRDYLKHKATRTKSRYFYEAYKIARNKTVVI